MYDGSDSCAIGYNNFNSADASSWEKDNYVEFINYPVYIPHELQLCSDNYMCSRISFKVL